MDFKQETERIVANKQTAFLRAPPEETTKSFHSQNLNLLVLWKVLSYH